MDIFDFLRQFVAVDAAHVLIVAGLVGAAAWAIVEGFNKVAQNGSPIGEGLPAQLKYWSTVALCVVIPFFASLIVSWHDNRSITFEAIALAAGVGFMAATTLHWVTSGAQKAAENKRIWKMRKQGKTVPPLTGPKAGPPPQTQP
jgi:hypothetical protein